MSDGVSSTVARGGGAGGESVTSSGVYARVAALLHESRQAAPDEVGPFLASRMADFGMADLSVYVTDYEQRRLVPIVGSATEESIPLDDSTGGRAFITARQRVEPVEDGYRVWSVVVDGAARLGMIAVTVAEVDDETRLLADSLAG